jgi:hypothetical protein
LSKFWSKILDGNDTLSSKRLITLIVAAHFILASFVILFFATYVILYLPKGKVEPELLNALKEVLEYDFYIILSGLGFVTSEGVVSMIMNRNKNTQPQNPYQNIDPTIPYDPNNPSNIL